MNPVIDFSLNPQAKELCFVAEISITFGLFIANNIEVYLANLIDRWVFIKTF